MTLRRISLLFAVALLLSSSAQADSSREDWVNVVLICADDLGYGDLGCYGSEENQTPRLDAMARQGARLTQFYSNCGYCAPSRGSLLTGRYPFRCGMTRNPHPKEDYPAHDQIGLPVSERTLGQAFQQAGYRTACIGKWHLGHQPRFYPVRRGFDEYFGILYSNDMHPVRLFEGEKPVEFPVDQATLTRRYTERSLDFIRKNRQRPFFLYLAHTMPHKPLVASDRFYGKSGNGLYGDVIAELDWSVGEVLDELKRLDLDRRTLVLFTSDNGPWFGGSTGGLRGMKSTWWEGGVRVPLLAYWPGTIPAGHESDHPAMLADLFPTALTATGTPLPEDRTLDGRNLLPTLAGQADPPHEAIFIFQERIRTVREGRWKLHYGGSGGDPNFPADWVDPRRPNGTTLLAPDRQYGPADYPGVRGGDTSRQHALYDLQTDPAEQHNVAEEHPEIVARLAQRVDRMNAEWKAAAE